MNIAIIIMLLIMSLGFYWMMIKLKDQLSKSFQSTESKMEDSVRTLSEYTNQSIEKVHKNIEDQATIASKEREKYDDHITDIEKRVMTAMVDGIEQLQTSIDSHSTHIENQLLEEIRKKSVQLEEQFHDVKKVKKELQVSINESSTTVSEQLSKLIDEKIATLHDDIIRTQESSSTHIQNQTEELVAFQKESTTGLLEQLTKMQKGLSQEFIVLSEEMTELMDKKVSETHLPDQASEKEDTQASEVEKTWIAEVQKKENSSHAIKLLESALIQLPGSRPLYKQYRDKMVKMLREEKPSDQKMIMERLMKFTHDHLTWCHPQSWKYAYQDYKSLSSLRVQYAERSKKLFLSDFENKMEQMEQLLDSEENADVLKVKMEQIDQQIQHSLLNHYPEEQKRYELNASKLMKKLGQEEDPQRISYNKWAIRKLSRIHSNFNNLSEHDRSTDHNIRDFATSMSEIDPSLLTSESQIYYQSVYHEIFKVATASFKPRMTEIVLDSKKETLGAV
ncbi:hypothetical protein EQV77_09190 [Halobacillus fulvus]|nr:hypothetical protein EQV77_09190 [Halobacillus fulvus]